jgi:hypothetical protein
MAWEQGPRGKRYYTRTLRAGGRRVREYLGSGPQAQAAAAADAVRRAERQAEAAARRRERDRLAEADGLVLELVKAADLVASAALVASGLHRHGGEWRRAKRHGGDERAEAH